MNTVENQMTAYLIVCAGVGMMFGAAGGVPGLFPGFFIPTLYIEGVVVSAIGAGWFFWEVRRSA